MQTIQFGCFSSGRSLPQIVHRLGFARADLFFRLPRGPLVLHDAGLGDEISSMITDGNNGNIKHFCKDVGLHMFSCRLINLYIGSIFVKIGKIPAQELR